MAKRLMGLRPGSGPKRQKWQIELSAWERREDERQEKEVERWNAPRKTERIFRGEKRKHVISTIMNLIGDWRFSPFEAEGPTRAGLREALCLSGYDWQRAEDEAVEIVGECLKAIPRPSWLEGQWQYTIPRENCQRCNRPIEEEDSANGSRYCSPVCFEASRVHSATFHEKVVSRQQAIVRFHAWREAQPKRTCGREGCGKKFKPSANHQKYCSLECYGLERRTADWRICENPDCRKEFAFHNHRLGRAGLWCSIACFQIRCRVGKPFVQCACDGCTNEFQPFKGQRWCSKLCANKQWDRNNRAKKKAAKEAKDRAAKSDHPIQKLFDAA